MRFIRKNGRIIPIGEKKARVADAASGVIAGASLVGFFKPKSTKFMLSGLATSLGLSLYASKNRSKENQATGNLLAVSGAAIGMVGTAAALLKLNKLRAAGKLLRPLPKKVDLSKGTKFFKAKKGDFKNRITGLLT